MIASGKVRSVRVSVRPRTMGVFGWWSDRCRGNGSRGVSGVRGIENDERLLACSLGDGVVRSEMVRRVGNRRSWDARVTALTSWTDRVIRLRNELGPFRLAYLEMLLRIADETASAMAEKRAAV